jgi:hypothetical protein
VPPGPGDVFQVSLLKLDGAFAWSTTTSKPPTVTTRLAGLVGGTHRNATDGGKFGPAPITSTG